MLPLGFAVRDKLYLSSTHSELQKWIYALCVPSAIIGMNALIYYFVHGREARWPSVGAGAWDARTCAAPWFSLLANLAGTVLFILLIRHQSVRSSSRIATSTMLTGAWVFTLIAFLTVE